MLKPLVSSVITTGVANVCNPNKVAFAADSVQLSASSLSVFNNQAEITSLDVKVKLALPVKLPQLPLKVVSFDVNVPGVAPSDAEHESEFPSSSSQVLAVETQYFHVPPSSPVIEVFNSKSALILNSFLIS